MCANAEYSFTKPFYVILTYINHYICTTHTWFVMQFHAVSFRASMLWKAMESGTMNVFNSWRMIYLPFISADLICSYAIYILIMFICACLYKRIYPMSASECLKHVFLNLYWVRRQMVISVYIVMPMFAIVM